MPPESPLDDVTLAVLAGGAGSRMGVPKGRMLLRGRPVLHHLLEQFSWPGLTLLVTGPGREHPPGWDRFGREVVDPVAGQGPLRGILTALENIRTPAVVVTTVDMPNIGPHHLRWVAGQIMDSGINAAMTDRADGGDRRIEPFPSVFRRTFADVIGERLLRNRRSVHSLAGLPGVTVVPSPPDWPASTWINLNTPGDLLRFE